MSISSGQASVACVKHAARAAAGEGVRISRGDGKISRGRWKEPMVLVMWTRDDVPGRWQFLR